MFVYRDGAIYSEVRWRPQAADDVKTLVEAWNANKATWAKEYRCDKDVDVAEIVEEVRTAMQSYPVKKEVYTSCPLAKATQKGYEHERAAGKKEASKAAAGIAAKAAHFAVGVADFSRVKFTDISLSDMNEHSVRLVHASTPTRPVVAGNGGCSISPTIQAPANQPQPGISTLGEGADMELIAFLVSEEGKEHHTYVDNLHSMLTPTNEAQEKQKRALGNLLSSCRFFFQRNVRQKKG